MSRRNSLALAVLLILGLLATGIAMGGGQVTQASVDLGAPPVAQPKGDPLRDMTQDMKTNHGKYDNALTALYEQQLAANSAKSGPAALLNGILSPLYGTDVRMSNGSVIGSNQNEFQIDINPTNGNFAIGTSNDSLTAGVGIFRTTNGGTSWTSADASAYGVQAACCDPGVAYGADGKVYVVILDTSPAATYILRSTDNGATWQGPTSVSTPDRENIAVDPSDSNIVYVTYSDLPATNRIKGYKSTDGGVTWGASFFVGDTAPPAGYEQSSDPQVASNGWLYVGYQQYTNSGTGCSAGVQNVLARSTDGGATFSWTVLPIIQGGACVGAQAGRGIFCVNAGGSSFRSRSHPIIGISPTDPTHVYMVYSGGDLEPTGTYSCGGGTGNHSDTLFRRSTDGGATFTAPIKVNSDPDGANKDQYYPWMAVNASGQIWAGWNDRREDANDFQSRWYQAFSSDEGTTWRNLTGAVGDDPVADVVTQPSTFIGDYHGLAATNANVLGMWFDSRISAAGDAYTDPQVPPFQGTPTPTVTGTPPTATRTRTPTQTATATINPSPTATPCQSGVIVNGGFETGTLTPWTVLGTNPAPVVSNALPHSGTYSALLGTLSGPEPTGDGSMYQTITVPASGGTLSYWWNGQTADTITFDWQDAYVTNTSGTILATIQHTCSTTAGWQNQTFNMAPYAGMTVRIEFLVHQDGFGDDTSMYVDDVLLTGPCGSPATSTATRTATTPPTNTPTNTPSDTPTLVDTDTPTDTPTSTPTNTTFPVEGTDTPTPTLTSTACPIQFTDVPNPSTFYAYIRCLACRGIVNGYTSGCETGNPCFRPNNNVTRGQLSKIVSNSAGFNDPQTTQMFEDVPVGSTFFDYIGRLASRGYISGYPCGGTGEPCNPPNNLPYFRTNNNATRGQITKIVSNAAGFVDPPAGQIFEDVPPGSTFYTYTQRLASRGVMQGYPCGGPGEPCNPPNNRPYFRTFNNATRGQTSKIVANTFFPDCETPNAVKR